MVLAGLLFALVLGACGAFQQQQQQQQRRRTVSSSSSSSSSSEDSMVITVPSALKSRIEAYLAVREASGDRVSEEQRTNEARANRLAMRANPAFKFSNSFLSLESLLPKEFEGKRFSDPLSYTELERFGYSDLIEPIMDLGGHMEVSRQLGITFTIPGPTIPYVDGTPEPVIQEYARGLTIGAALDDEIAKMLSTPSSKISILDEEGGAARVASAQAALLDLPSRRTQRRVSARESRGNLPTQWPVFLAPLSLGTPARLYAVVVFFALSAPLSPATHELAAFLTDSSTSLDAPLLAVACFAGFSNVAAAALTLTRPPPPNSTPPFAFFRALLGGPLALLEDNAATAASS